MPAAWFRNAWVDASAVDKATIRNGARDAVPLYATVAELRALTTAGIRCAAVLNGAVVKVYTYDPADTTTADDGALVLVTADGQRFKDRSAVLASGDVTTALGYTPRERLTAARTYYIRTDGNDANNGRTNVAGGAFLTIQKAIDVVFGTLDLGGFNVTIQIGNGTYAGIVATSPQVGAGKITLSGDTTTPANVIMQASTGTACITAIGTGVALYVQGVKVAAATGQGWYSGNGAFIAQSGKNEIGAFPAGQQIMADGNGVILLNAAMVLAGGSAGNHLYALSGGRINIQGATWTITGSPTIAAFAAAAVGGSIFAVSNTFSGAVTGTRYSATLGGVIQTNGGGASFFPGTVAGATATGGQYA